MSYPTYVPRIGNDLAERIDNELCSAEEKFPNQSLEISILALVEEVGEACQAVLQERNSDAKQEFVQVAVMAIRCYKTITEAERAITP